MLALEVVNFCFCSVVGLFGFKNAKSENISCLCNRWSKIGRIIPSPDLAAASRIVILLVLSAYCHYQLATLRCWVRFNAVA